MSRYYNHPQYQEILIQNNELKEALEKATQLMQANKLHDDSTVDFEFSLSYEDVQSYVSSRGNISKLWFNGILEKQTGRVIYAQSIIIWIVLYELQEITS
jgi:hypothetical protein